MKSSTIRGLALLPLAAVLAVATSGCLFFGGAKKTPLTGTKAAPDTVLYNQALDAIKHNRYTQGQLLLQTLINTYPDSEYLAKAKLAWADSFYKEGGVEGLTQAAAQYKDFITFFPFLQEAAYAQYRIAMCHFRMMEKADRDPTQALEGEAAFQTMLLRYPNSKWTAQAEQGLRDVQEILAEHQFDVAQFYFIRGNLAAAAARLLELTQRYPLFSQADQANWMLGQFYQKVGKTDFAARFYQNIVREYPLSSYASGARNKLVALHSPVPQPDPVAMARMKKQEQYDRTHHGASLIADAMGILKSGPSVARAADFGQPDLAPETTIVAARTDTGFQVLEPAVVSAAASSAGARVTNSLSISGVAPSGDEAISGSSGPTTSSAASPASPPSSSSVGATVIDSSSPAGGSETKPAPDPLKALPATAKNAKGKATKASGSAKPTKKKEKNAKKAKKDKKKKSFFRKIIP